MPGNLALAWEVFEIVWINILLSGDNAILIALACRRLPEEQRRWGVLLGSLGGVALRIGFTLAIVQLLHVPLLKTAGALLLLYVAIKLPHGEHDRTDVDAKPNLWGAVMSIIVADAVMSLDNVLAIAAAAHGSMQLIVFGLALSAPLVMFGAGVSAQIARPFSAADLGRRGRPGLGRRRDGGDRSLLDAAPFAAGDAALGRGVRVRARGGDGAAETLSSLPVLTKNSADRHPPARARRHALADPPPADRAKNLADRRYAAP